MAVRMPTPGHAPAAHRGWAWRWLNGLADGSMAARMAHDAAITGLAASPDGRTLAVAPMDGSVRLLEAKQDPFGPDSKRRFQFRMPDSGARFCTETAAPDTNPRRGVHRRARERPDRFGRPAK